MSQLVRNTSEDRSDMRQILLIASIFINEKLLLWNNS